MTREEAKGSLIAIKNKYLANYGEDSIINILIDEYDIQAIDVAIQALEQEPSDDCISRQAVLNTEYQVKIINDIEYVMLSEVQMKMRKLPSVKPQEKTGHWEWIQYDSNPNIGNWHCSECRTIIPHMPEETDNTPIYKWCPMCSAKMSENPTSSKPEISSFYGLRSYVRERSEE